MQTRSTSFAHVRSPVLLVSNLMDLQLSHSVLRWFQTPLPGMALEDNGDAVLLRSMPESFPIIFDVHEDVLATKVVFRVLELPSKR